VRWVFVFGKALVLLAVSVCQVTAGIENVLIGHNTWAVYSSMMRIFKHYHLNTHSGTNAHSLSFASQPGTFLYVG